MTDAITLLKTEEGWRDIMTGEIEPFLDSIMEKGTFESYDKTSIAWRIYRNPEAKANVFLIHGFSEFIEKYNEMFYELVTSGFEVYTIDVRGHGDSQRFTDDPSMVELKSFDEYTGDIKFFYDLKLKNSDRPNLLLGHSMGGGIAIYYTEHYPGDFERAVFSSPMVRMKTGKFPYAVVKSVAFFAKLFGKGKTYAAGQHSFNPTSRLEFSSCKSPERYEYIMDMRRGNVRNQTWGGSYDWVFAACKAMDYLIKPHNVAKIKIPAIVLGAGRDHMVDTDYIEKFADLLPYGRYIVYPESRHEIYHGYEEERMSFYKEVIDFLKQSERR